MGRISREARLCFVLLWTLSDDFGRLRGNSRILSSLLYPYDDDVLDHMDGWLVELEHEGCIVRYQDDGNTYMQILHWDKHQRVDKPTASKIPQFCESSRILANPPVVSANIPLGKEGKGIGKEGNRNRPSDLSREKSVNDYSNEFEQFWERYPKNGASKKTANQSYIRAMKEGAEHENIIRGVAAYRAYAESTGTPIAHATTWLNQQRWTVDYENLNDRARVGSQHKADSPHERMGRAWAEAAGINL
jgi:hypothetical protein